MIRWLMMVFVVALGGPALAADTQVIDIAVKGMSCPFCVYNVEKKLRAVDGVATASVDLKQGRARVVMQPQARPDTEQLRQAIIDAGFTPGDIVVSGSGAAEDFGSKPLPTLRQ